MIDAQGLEHDLCKTFCAAISVNPVPCGYAVGTPFPDQSGDLIGFYVVEDGDGFRLEDDGAYLAQLKGSGIPIDGGGRAKLLEEILKQGDAFRDQDTCEIRSKPFDRGRLGPAMIRFLSALIRVRDLELPTREAVRSTFRDDALAALTRRYGAQATLDENTSVDDEFSEFPADLIIRPKAQDTKTGALCFATSNDKLNEALLLQMEAERHRRENIQIIALIEEPDMRPLSRKKFQRAQNRGLMLPIFRGDEKAAVDGIGHRLRLPQAA
ncbi:MAG: DUF1828 domain-containing protein [Rhodobacteraceae bacterium]|nr:DUF1828 domain-containing protein [Paracoccaceae bacterium]